MLTTSSDVPPPLLVFGGGPVDSTQATLGSQAAIRSSAASCVFLIYDIILTIDQEVEFIWSRNWSFVKLLYFFVRYFPMLVQIPLLFMAVFDFTPRQCFIWVTFQDVATVTIIVAVDYILFLRVNALYNDNRAVKIILLVSYIVEICVLLVAISLNIPAVMYDSSCIVTDFPILITLTGLALCSFQTMLFAFTAVKFIRAVRHRWGNVRIFTLLMRDGTWAFFAIFVTIVVNACLFLGPAGTHVRLLYGWLISVFSFSGYRVLLNLQHLPIPLRTARTSSQSVTTSTGNGQFTSVFMGPECDAEEMGSSLAHNGPLPLAEHTEDRMRGVLGREMVI